MKKTGIRKATACPPASQRTFSVNCHLTRHHEGCEQGCVAVFAFQASQGWRHVQWETSQKGRKGIAKGYRPQWRLKFWARSYKSWVTNPTFQALFKIPTWVELNLLETKSYALTSDRCSESSADWSATHATATQASSCRSWRTRPEEFPWCRCRVMGVN